MRCDGDEIALSGYRPPPTERRTTIVRNGIVRTREESLALPELDPVWRSVAVIAAAAPMGANVYLVAQRYETYLERSSTAVLLSTVLSVVTISALVVALG